MEDQNLPKIPEGVEKTIEEMILNKLKDSTHYKNFINDIW